MDEAAIIADLLAPLAAGCPQVNAFGFQDDAALIHPNAAPLIITKDMVIEGVHFPHGHNSGDAVRKAVRVNVSDLCAKGAKPLSMFTGFVLPRSYTPDDVRLMTTALKEEAALFAMPLAGGDTTRHDGACVISLTAVGVPSVPERPFVPRGGAVAGDHIYVIGAIGDAYIGLKGALGPRCPVFSALTPQERAHVLRCYHLPHPQVNITQAVARYAGACMDVSDGLLLDAGRMAAASCVAFHVDPASVPYSPAVRGSIDRGDITAPEACSGGDDYALLCAIPPARIRQAEADFAASGYPFACIGTVRAGQGLHVTGQDAALFTDYMRHNPGGYLHEV